MFDKRVAEITGSAITALSASGSDCRLPLNVNDSELSMHAKDPPNPYPGPTEMLFCLTRIELTIAAAPTGTRPSAHTPPGAQPSKSRLQFSPSPATPDVVSHVATVNLPHDTEGCIAYIENAYLKQCDTKIPLHFFTLMMTRQALCKLRVIDFLSRGVTTDTLEDAERDALFVEATRIVEFDNIIQSAEQIQGFKWYTHLHFPFPAYIFLMSELRHRTQGELCERAWEAIIENHDRRNMMRNFRSPMHVAFGSFFIKAWDAREAVELQQGRQLPTPRLVTMLRQTMGRWKRPPGSGGVPGAPAGPPGAGRGSTPTASQGAAPQGPPSAPSSAPGHSSGPGGAQGMAPGQGHSHGHGSGHGPPLGAGGMGPVEPNVTTQAGMYANKGMADPSAQFGGGGGGGSSGAGGGVMMDDSVMVPMFDGVNNMFGSALPEVDFGQMDWNYLMQYGGFSGFANNQGAYPGGQGA